jgi:hypothetical protein
MAIIPKPLTGATVLYITDLSVTETIKFLKLRPVLTKIEIECITIVQDKTPDVIVSETVVKEITTLKARTIVEIRAESQIP